MAESSMKPEKSAWARDQQLVLREPFLLKKEPFLMSSIRQDVRYALRMLWKHRFATLVCAGALALGIGANTAMFSLAEAFLLHPVPLDDVDRIVALVDSHPRHNVPSASVAPATYLEWQSQSHSFDQLGAYDWDGASCHGFVDH